MAFKKRYILASEAEERIVKLWRKENSAAADIFNTAVDACQTIILDMYDNSSENVVEVVRCKDCRYWDTNGYGAEYDTEGFGWCDKIAQFDTQEDWLCGWGERREG